ncbi:MAG: class C beta-lactamase-related serine hydrolase [Chitinophagaceae bacterium]|nr:MAG: class C beta-lactamase-related serine hydrolase [Chitinophagaceae bacterium]
MISLFSVIADSQTAAGQTKARIDKKWGAYLDSLITDNMKESGIVAIGAAIIIDKKLVWTKGYGYADKAKRIPFEPTTIMNIASITKTFTGVCMMRLVEEGKLSLDEDINKYLPFKVVNPFFPDEKITLRDIATHTSGITDRFPVYDSVYHYGGDSPVPLESFLRDYFIPGRKFYSKENFLNHKPGSYREYCNISVALAGLIVERISGKKLNLYSKEVIFHPLKMQNSGWFLSEVNLKNHSMLYDKQDDSLKQIPLYGETTYPDGGVRTSVAELSRFFIAMLNNGEYEGARLLKKETVQEITTFQFTESKKPENVDPSKLNSGIFWATKFGGTKMGHAGTDPGVKTEMLSDLKKEVAVILFSNTSLSEKDLIKYHSGIFTDLFNSAIELKKMIK